MAIVNVAPPPEMTLEQLRFEIGQCELAQRRMGKWSPEMDEIESRRLVFEAELRRRTSIFNGAFRGGV